MKKFILLSAVIIFMTSCVTVPNGARDWAGQNGYIASDKLADWAALNGYISKESLATWALENGYIQSADLDQVARDEGYILISEIPPTPLPNHPLLPHPTIPELLPKADIVSLARNIVVQDGVIDSFKLLVEIYERMYVNTGMKYSFEEFADMTLAELKQQYYDTLALTEKTSESMKR